MEKVRYLGYLSREKLAEPGIFCQGEVGRTWDILPGRSWENLGYLAREKLRESEIPFLGEVGRPWDIWPGRSWENLGYFSWDPCQGELRRTRNPINFSAREKLGEPGSI